ncbi:MAG: peptidylprolyl isomerase [Dehalococcoidales bacterium]|nr:peptidylprolyl isomerase [Dehalococcoidales bacterium]
MKKRYLSLMATGAVILSLMLAVVACGGKTTTPKTYTAYPPMTIDQSKTYTATIKTNYGDFAIELFPKEAPLAVNSFVFLAREGFFNNVKFHRVLKGFVIQTGDPTGTGMGGPGYSFADELPTTRDYIGGVVAMANSGPDTNGSQFFITLSNLTGRLQKNYTIFGQVISGADVILKIADVPVKTLNNEASSPTVDVHIISVTITEK